MSYKFIMYGIVLTSASMMLIMGLLAWRKASPVKSSALQKALAIANRNLLWVLIVSFSAQMLMTLLLSLHDGRSFSDILKDGGIEVLKVLAIFQFAITAIT